MNTNIARSLLVPVLACSVIALLAPAAHSQLKKPGFPKSPLNPNPYWKKSKVDKGGTSGTGSNAKVEPVAIPTHEEGDLELGSTAKGTFDVLGSTGVVRFHAVKGTKLDVDVNTGAPKSLTARLISPSGAPIAHLKPEGGRLALRDQELPKSGVYSIEVRLEKDDPVAYSIAPTGELPKRLETEVTLGSDGKGKVEIEGMLRRKLAKVEVEIAGVANANLAASLRDPYKVEVANATLDAVAPGVPTPLFVNRAVGEPGDWILAIESPAAGLVVKVRADFANPPPARKTIKLGAP